MTRPVIAPSPILTGAGESLAGAGDREWGDWGAPPPAAPAGPLPWWRRLLRGLHRLLCWLVALLLAILVIPVTMQIFSRFTQLIPHYIWTEEMARFLFIWVIMLGAMLGVRENSHFDVDVWPRLGPRQDARLRLVSRVAVLVVAGVFVGAGIEFTEFAWYRISELAELPLWLIHVAWPVTGLVWIAFCGEQLVDDWRLASGAASGADAGAASGADRR